MLAVDDFAPRNNHDRGEHSGKALVLGLQRQKSGYLFCSEQIQQMKLWLCCQAREVI